MKGLFRLVFFLANFPTACVFFLIRGHIYTERKYWVTQNSCRYFIRVCMNVCIYGLFFLCYVHDFIIPNSVHLSHTYTYTLHFPFFLLFLFLLCLKWMTLFLYYYCCVVFLFSINVVVMCVGIETIGNVWRLCVFFVCLKVDGSLNSKIKWKIFF